MGPGVASVGAVYPSAVHRRLACVSCLAHMVFVGFTVIGGFLAWLVPALLVPHLAAAAWGGRMAITRAACPLSRIENWARRRAGKPQLHERGFVAHYFEGKVYPARWARKVEVAVGGLVVSSWAVLAAR